LGGSISKLLLVTICWLCVFGVPVAIALYTRRMRDLRFLIAAGAIIAAVIFALLVWLVTPDAWLDAARPIPLLAAVVVAAIVTLMWRRHRRGETGAAARTDDSFLADHRGPAVDALQKHLRLFTSPGTTLVCMPEGLLTNFLARRRNPTGHLNFTPPALIMFGEDRMVADFKRHPPDLIAIFTHPTPEYGAT